MKASEFSAALVAFSPVADGRRTDELRVFASIFSGGKDETVAARLKRLPTSLDIPASLKASLAAIAAGLIAVGAKKQAAEKEQRLRRMLPKVDDADLQAILNDPRLILYTDQEIPKAYQVWAGGLQGIHSPSYNISANGSEPFGNRTVDGFAALAWSKHCRRVPRWTAFADNVGGSGAAPLDGLTLRHPPPGPRDLALALSRRASKRTSSSPDHDWAVDGSPQRANR